MGIFKSSSSGRKTVGAELAAVLPDDPRPWFKQPHLLKLNFCILSLVMFSSANGYDGSMMNGLQALPQWQIFMNYPTGAWLGFINAIAWLGSAITYPIGAWFANRYGRRRGIWIGYGFLVLATAMQAASQHPTTFVIARLFLGCASAWFSIAVPLLITETAYPTQRGIATALFNCGVSNLVYSFPPRLQRVMLTL
jgi:MFS family permease